MTKGENETTECAQHGNSSITCSPRVVAVVVVVVCSSLFERKICELCKFEDGFHFILSFGVLSVVVRLSHNSPSSICCFSFYFIRPFWLLALSPHLFLSLSLFLSLPRPILHIDFGFRLFAFSSSFRLSMKSRWCRVRVSSVTWPGMANKCSPILKYIGGRWDEYARRAGHHER